LFLPSAASAKSFGLAAVQVEAILQPDASMRVVEHITYDFQGEFHNGTRAIPRGPYEVVDVRVTDRANGQALPFEGDAYDLAWHFTARDEERTFDISYTVLRAAQVGPDVAELYWKFVGPDHPGINRVRISIEVPGDGLDVRAWAHGPLQGLVQPAGNTVLLSADGVPAGEFVEARVAVPSNVFTVAPSGPPRLPGTLAEEQKLASEANAARARQASGTRNRARLADALGVLAIVAAVGGWAAFLLLWIRYGREYRAQHDVGEYLRELPDDPPAYIAMLRGWGAVPPTALSATLVDLAQRGYLTIEELREDRRFLPDKTDWKYTRTQKMEPVRGFEASILEQLFSGSATVTQSEFTSWCRAHRTSALRWWEDVQSSAKTAFRSQKYIEGGKGPVYAANTLCGVLVVLVGVGALSSGSPIGVLAVVSGAAQLAMTVILRRRTQAGAQRLAEWDAVERFLRDFSQLEEAPVESLILWERYLVYAVALGVTATVARALAARIPPEQATTAGFAPWYIGMHGPGALDSIGSLSEFSNSVGPAIVAAATPPSSSSSGSGGGGGFSGGGGGGGGGGSIGAS
jgi:uncharacterized membrane protein